MELINALTDQMDVAADKISNVEADIVELIQNTNFKNEDTK